MRFQFFKIFGLRPVAIAAALLVVSAILAEYTERITAQSIAKQFILPAIGILLVIVCLVPLGINLINRLLAVIGGSAVARFPDLFLIGFTYLSVILGFGVIYQMLANITGKEVFAFSPFRSQIRLIDNIYVSGVTIATIGYGDILPVFWFTKLLVVSEALIGILLTATVLGFFIGSLLSSQQQDQQRRWYAGFQRLYLKAINEYFVSVNSLDDSLDLPELRTKTLRLRLGLLQTIASLVEAQYAPSPSARVCANWMRLYQVDYATDEYLRLAEPYTSPLLRGKGMKTLWAILILKEWGEKPPKMPGPGELALPVYDPDDPEKARRELPGAPLAVAIEDGYHIVPDTRLLDLSNQDPDVKNRMESYFEEHRAELRSFASVRIDYPGGTLGVVNIQSSEPDLCGTTEYVQRTVVDMIRPFATYLAQLALFDELKEQEANERKGTTVP